MTARGLVAEDALQRCVYIEYLVINIMFPRLMISHGVVGHQYYVSTNMCAKLPMPIRPSLGAANEQITKMNGDIAGERGVLPMNKLSRRTET